LIYFGLTNVDEFFGRQVAVLFTSPGGQRRLRIHNLALSVCNQMADLYRSCDLDTVMNLLMKQSVTKLTESSPKQIKY
jgi:protein transport protein SEC24